MSDSTKRGGLDSDPSKWKSADEFMFSDISKYGFRGDRLFALPFEKGQNSVVLNLDDLEDSFEVQCILGLCTMQPKNYVGYDSVKIEEIYYGMVHPVVDLMYMMGSRNMLALGPIIKEVMFCNVGDRDRRRLYLESLPRIAGLERNSTGVYSKKGKLVWIPFSSERSTDPEVGFSFFQPFSSVLSSIIVPYEYCVEEKEDTVTIKRSFPDRDKMEIDEEIAVGATTPDFLVAPKKAKVECEETSKTVIIAKYPDKTADDELGVIVRSCVKGVLKDVLPICSYIEAENYERSILDKIIIEGGVIRGRVDSSFIVDLHEGCIERKDIIIKHYAEYFSEPFFVENINTCFRNGVLSARESLQFLRKFKYRMKKIVPSVRIKLRRKHCIFSTWCDITNRPLFEENDHALVDMVLTTYKGNVGTKYCFEQFKLNGLLDKYSRCGLRKGRCGIIIGRSEVWYLYYYKERDEFPLDLRLNKGKEFEVQVVNRADDWLYYSFCCADVITKRLADYIKTYGNDPMKSKAAMRLALKLCDDQEVKHRLRVHNVSVVVRSTDAGISFSIGYQKMDRCFNFDKLPIFMQFACKTLTLSHQVMAAYIVGKFLCRRRSVHLGYYVYDGKIRQVFRESTSNQ